MTKIEKLMDTLTECLNVISRGDFAAAPGDTDIWRDLAEITRICKKDLRYGIESLAEEMGDE